VYLRWKRAFNLIMLRSKERRDNLFRAAIDVWTLRSGKAPVRPCHNLKCLQNYYGEVLIPPKDSVAQIQIWEDRRASPCSSCFLTAYAWHWSVFETPEHLKFWKNLLIRACTFEKHCCSLFLYYYNSSLWLWHLLYVSFWIGGCVLSECYQACTDILIDSSAC